MNSKETYTKTHYNQTVENQRQREFFKYRVALYHPGWRSMAWSWLTAALNSQAHACNPSTLGGWGGQIPWSQEFKICLAKMVKPCLQKHKKPSVMAGACNPSYMGGWGRGFAWAWEVSVSQDGTTALQPGWQNETPYGKIKKSIIWLFPFGK